MFDTPFSSGEPARQRGGEVRYFEPVIAATATAEPAVVAGFDSTEASAHAAPRRPAVSWREMRCIGFPEPAGPRDRQDDPAGEPEQPRLPGLDAPAIPIPLPLATNPRSAPGPEVSRGRDASRRHAAGAALPRRLAAQLANAGQYGAAVGSAALLAAFAYFGSDHLSGLAGAMTSEAAPAHQTATLLPENRPEAPVPAGDMVDRAAQYLERAKAGDPVSQYNIAVLYARGDGLVQDYFSAASWFREAALNGNAAAQFNLGVVYERGLGVKQNAAEAVLWYRRAAEHNYPAAQYNLAIAYAEGRGTPQDPVAAARWYHQAAEQGLTPAMVNFAIVYEKGEGVERSLPDAYAWYRAAARRGDSAAGKRAGELFQQFSGADKEKAVMLAASVVGALREGPAAPAPAPLAAPPKPAIQAASAPGPKPAAVTRAALR